MFYTTNLKDRAEFIASLRQLADFLDTNPAVPVPMYGADLLLPADTYEDGGKEQVEHIARLLGAPIDDATPDGHYTAERPFGCLRYRAASIPGPWNAAYDARHSYEKSIILDAS